MTDNIDIDKMGWVGPGLYARIAADRPWVRVCCEGPVTGDAMHTLQAMPEVWDMLVRSEEIDLDQQLRTGFGLAELKRIMERNCNYFAYLTREIRATLDFLDYRIYEDLGGPMVCWLVDEEDFMFINRLAVGE